MPSWPKTVGRRNELRCNFEHRTPSLYAVPFGCSIQVSMSVEDQAIERTCPRIVVEGVQHDFLPAAFRRRGQPENIAEMARLHVSRAIEVTSTVEDHAGVRSCSILTVKPME